MTIKVISLNLWWGGHLFPAILDFLNSEDADIVALQEVYNGQDASLEDKHRSMETLKRLGYPYADFTEAFIQDDPAGKLPSGNAVLSKFPIVDSGASFLVEPTQADYKDIPELFPILPRVLQRVSLHTPVGQINVFNFHGVWDLAGDSPSPARRGMVNKILEDTAGKDNVILTGDSNAQHTNPALKPLEERFKSVFGHELKSTFNMRRKDRPGYATAAVDHMYLSPNVKVLSKDCPDIDISDHRPLIATLEL